MASHSRGAATPEEPCFQTDARAGDVGDRCVVDSGWHAAGNGGADHASVQHAGQTNIGDELVPCEDLFRDVGARDRRTDDAVVARSLRLRAAAGDQSVAVDAVPLHRHIELPVADQLGVADLPRRVGCHAHHAVPHPQRIDGNAEMLRRQIEQHAPRLGAGVAQGDAAALDAGAAGGAALVHRARGVAHDDGDAFDCDVEFLGDDLTDGDIDALAGVHLAEEGGDAAVLLDGEPGIQLVRRRSGGRWACVEALGPMPRSPNDTTSAPPMRSRERREMLPMISPYACAARVMARRIDKCEPQRHFRPDSPSRMSASVACGLSRSSAAAVMIQPFRQ